MKTCRLSKRLTDEDSSDAVGMNRRSVSWFLASNLPMR